LHVNLGLTGKLLLAAGAALALLAGGSGVGFYASGHAIAGIDTVARGDLIHERAMQDLNLAFRIQVQEWKNVLLRGSDPKQLDKYWGAFEERAREVRTLGLDLGGRLYAADSGALLQRFLAAHQEMGAA
jgi:hypothetical protein